MSAWLEQWWPHLSSAAAALLSLFFGGHALLNKRDVRSAAAWVTLILLVPFLGAGLYVLLGMNRIRRAATQARHGRLRYAHAQDCAPPLRAEALEARLPLGSVHLASIARSVEKTTSRPLLTGNRVVPLRDGDEAYPEMLRAIDEARHTVALGTYIFDDDPAGQRFVDALARAHARGVQVRVLIDDAGARYSFPAVDWALRRRGVRVARFLRVWTPWSVAFANLRNHRKILVVDGKVGFTGGMNIRQGCVLQENPRHPTRDLHFRLEGPVVTELMDVFAEDWTFTTGEVMEAKTWFPAVEPAGEILARAVSDGPEWDLDCLRWTLHAALSSARRRVRIVTPYFLPDEPLIAMLSTAALRGVEVDIVLPARGNLRFVDWAMQGELWKVLQYGCRVWLTPPPFDHSKLMTVDGAWSLVGSANWDPRSLRLNFELGVECYDEALALRLDALAEERIASATRLLLDTHAQRPLPVRLRNGAARLLSPYL